MIILKEGIKAQKKKQNYFITEEEIKILWKYAGEWSSKFQLILGFALMRGLRIGEIMGININDFSDNFNKIDIILEKSHIQDRFPIIEPLKEMVIKYIYSNAHMLKDGFLFPYYSRKGKMPYMDTKTAEALFAKIRKKIGIKHPEFLEHTLYKTKNGCVRKRYRIGYHSLRRFFETELREGNQSIERIAHIMRYRDTKTVYTYLDSYRTWKDEKNVLENCIGSKVSKISQFSKGQRSIYNF